MANREPYANFDLGWGCVTALETEPNLLVIILGAECEMPPEHAEELANSLLAAAKWKRESDERLN